MIIYEKLYERAGNDAYLKDYVELHYNTIGLYLYHKKRWTGWGGDINENYTLDLDIDDIEGSQEKLDKYIYEHNLYTKYPNGSEYGVKINLNEFLNLL